MFASQENAVLSSVPAEPDQFTVSASHNEMQTCAKSEGVLQMTAIKFRKF